jgi:hypothetical protein
VERYSWSELTHLQIGRFGEYFVKMEFALYGFEIYTSEVDDRGIDFVARHGGGRFYEVQVKSVRNTNYVCMLKDSFPLNPERLLALVVLVEHAPPCLYLIPATAWQTPDAQLLVDREYKGLKSRPEYGILLSKGSRRLLKQYGFADAVQKIMAQASAAEGTWAGEQGAAPDGRRSSQRNGRAARR